MGLGLAGAIVVACSSTETPRPPLHDGGPDAGIASDASDVTVEIDAGPPAPDPPIALAAGSGHACSLGELGSVRCWGSDYYRQLGSGLTARTTCDVFGVTAPCQPPATIVPGLGRARAIAAGGATTCALREDGHVLCWGLNDSGQLGHAPGTAGDLECGTLACNPVPSEIAGLPASIERIAVGDGFACAAEARALHCWGRNDLGQLGRGFDGPPSPAPALVTSVSGEISSLAARTRVCATVDGTLRCWGSNGVREMDLGTYDVKATGCRNDSSPCVKAPFTYPLTIEMTGPLGAVAISERATCVIDGAKALFCGGSALRGEVGNQQHGNTVHDFTRIGLPGPAVAVTAGPSHLCVTTEDGAVFCWGVSSLGQLGTSPVVNDCESEDPRPCAHAPVMVAGPADDAVHAVTAGTEFTLALGKGGRIYGWGLNVFGQLGRAPASEGESACSIAADVPPGTCAFNPR